MTRSLLGLDDSARRRQVADTLFRCGLGVALVVAFPAFSDIFRLWERRAGLNPQISPEVFEYPPIGALYFESIAWLPSGRWAVVVNGVIMMAAAAAITWVLSRVVDPSSEVDMGLWVASPALLILVGVNWDVLTVLLAVLAIAALYRGSTGRAGALTGIGTGLKIFPGGFVLPVLPRLEGWKQRAVFLAAGGFVLAGSYAIYAAADPDGWLFHLEFADARNDIESTVWGLLDVALSWFGVEVPLTTINLVSTLAVAAALVLVTVWVSRRQPGFARLAALSLLALIVFNKVYKPQYILWVLPFLAWIGVRRRNVRIAEMAALVQFAAIYFAWPSFVYPLETLVRVTALVFVAREVVAGAPRPRRDASVTV